MEHLGTQDPKIGVKVGYMSMGHIRTRDTRQVGVRVGCLNGKSSDSKHEERDSNVMLTFLTSTAD